MCVFFICSSKGQPSSHHSSLNISRSETKNFSTKNSKENCDFIGGFNFKKRQKSSMDNNRYGLMRQRSDVWRSLRDGDFEEEDVWDVLRDKKDSNSKIGISIESSISIPRKLSSSPSAAAAARMIPRATSSSGSCSSNNSSVQQQSAPVNIPDWSKICKKKSSKNANSWHDHHPDDDDDDDDDDYHRDSDDEGDDDIDNYKLPPHELISRRLARSQISSFSVLEGVGRKLKGRDLSKVRNAVLTKTGFLESP